MAARQFTLSIRSGNRTIGSLTMVPGCAEVQIGRSHQCALQTPPDDHSVSGHHAKLYWKGNALYLADDGSRNGVYYRSARLTKPRKVSNGDLFALGNCTLVCEVPTSNRVAKADRKYHQLEYLNGDNAGKQIDIRPKDGEDTFTIGLDPGNALCLSDMLVSRHHAFLETKENGGRLECWLHDCGSRNGTYVNGEKLSGKERLLKDNDKISIAYFDFRFLDRSVKHTRLFLWVKILAVAATLIVMGAIYLAVVVFPGKTMEDYLRLARESAANKDFVFAKEVLRQSRLSRDADKYRTQIDALESQVERWEKTASEWTQAKDDLAGGYFKRAQKALDPLVGGAVDAWVWNGTTAIEEKREAEFAAQALRRFYTAQDVLAEAADGIPEQQADRIKGAETELTEFLQGGVKAFADYPYLAELKKDLEERLSSMAKIRAGFEAVDGAIAKLDEVNPNFSALSITLDTISRDKEQHAAVRAYADKYKAPCMELAEAKRFISGEFDELNAMRFSDLRKREKELKLPAKELCQRHPQLSNHRVKLEGHHLDAQRLAKNLESIVNGMAELGVENGSCGQPVRHVLDVKRWQEALTFACFKSKPPTVRRKNPSSTYDELLGVDYTFQGIRAMPQNYNGFCLRMIGFSPDCVESRNAFERIAVFVKFVSERPAWLRKGELGTFYEYCRKILTARDGLISYLKKYEGSPRAKLVTRYYAGFFAEDFEYSERQAIAAEFKRIQKEVAELNEKYDNAPDPVEQIALRAKILATGLPGDPQMHAKWVALYEGGVQ